MIHDALCYAADEACQFQQDMLACQMRNGQLVELLMPEWPVPWTLVSTQRGVGRRVATLKSVPISGECGWVGQYVGDGRMVLEGRQKRTRMKSGDGGVEKVLNGDCCCA